MTRLPAAARPRQAAAARRCEHELTLWTHNAGNTAELGAIKQIVNDYNASQTKYKVKVQAFPQDSYNQSVTAAATVQEAAVHPGHRRTQRAQLGVGRVPRPVDRPGRHAVEVPADAPSASTTTRSTPYGYYDVASGDVRPQVGARARRHPHPDDRQAVDGGRVRRGLAKLKASGEFDYPLDLGTGDTGEWWPYAYSPFLQSFGGDLIDRTDYKSADGALNGARGRRVGHLVPRPGRRRVHADEVRYGPAPPTSSTARRAIMYSGIWAAATLRQEVRRRRASPAAAGLR